jgi:hypothetical protein
LLITASLTVVLVVLSTFIHYEVLRLCNENFPIVAIEGRAKVLLAMGAGFCSHLVQIAIFAAAYRFLQDIGLGSLRGQVPLASPSLLYFSAETYTSLGFGDLYPVGPMRLVAGFEALTGLLMISWTASFTYLEMSRYWAVPPR